LKITADFVRSAAGPSDFPAEDLPEIAMVGRSNVGKSSLINALVRQRVARTSAAPGKTRLANIYRVARGSQAPIHLVDLPGYGYARGGGAAAREFEELTRAFFGRQGQVGRVGRVGQVGRVGKDIFLPEIPDLPDLPDPADPTIAGLLLVDSRHPGLESDRQAWAWLQTVVDDRAIVATKIDKLARGQRIRAMRELESVFEHSVLPVSAATGEGLDELWKLIDRLANNSRRSSPPRATVPQPRSGLPEPTRRPLPPKGPHPRSPHPKK
jgi:GTP-binding protein